MKTAEEILIEMVRPDCVWENSLDNIPMADVTPIMRVYAKQVAEQALKDAAENATAHVYYHPEDRGEPDAQVDSESILSTPNIQQSIQVGKG